MKEGYHISVQCIVHSKSIQGVAGTSLPFSILTLPSRAISTNRGAPPLAGSAIGLSESLTSFKESKSVWPYQTIRFQTISVNPWNQLTLKLGKRLRESTEEKSSISLEPDTFRSQHIQFFSEFSVVHKSNRIILESYLMIITTKTTPSRHT